MSGHGSNFINMTKHNLKYSKHPDDAMTLKELEIWHSQEVAISNCPSCKGRRGKTYKETMKDLNVTATTISRTKKKKDYNALAQARLEQNNHTINEYVDDLIRKTKAQKGVTVKGEGRIMEDDNVTQMNAITEIGEIFGAKAPKQVDLKHSLAAMSDEELQNEIDKSVEEITENANTQRAITGSLGSGAVVTSTIVTEESTVAIDT
jgi:hypothetical protein